MQNVEIGMVRSSATLLFDRAHTTSYSTLSETMNLYPTTFKLFV